MILILTHKEYNDYLKGNGGLEDAVAFASIILVHNIDKSGGYFVYKDRVSAKKQEYISDIQGLLLKHRTHKGKYG